VRLKFRSKSPIVCDGVLLRRHVRVDDVVKVPKYAVTIETSDPERRIPGRTRPKKKARWGRVVEAVSLYSSMAP
jgi:hypothetical protein